MNIPIANLRALRSFPGAAMGSLPRLLLLAASSALLLAACAGTSPAYHRYVMKGQVLSVQDDSLTVCIGTPDGAEVGQELALLRNMRTHGSIKAAGPAFRREPIGRVRIAMVFDEHYAKAQILKGRPRVDDIVELDGR